jgi:hypothetical protein
MREGPELAQSASALSEPITTRDPWSIGRAHATVCRRGNIIFRARPAEEPREVELTFVHAACNCVCQMQNAMSAMT